VVEKKVRQAVKALSGQERLDAVKFFDENKDDKEFIYFLHLIFKRFRDVEMESRDKLAEKLGDDLACAFLDHMDKTTIDVDKRLLETVVWAEEESDKEDFINGMKKLVKYLEKNKE